MLPRIFRHSLRAQLIIAVAAGMLVLFVSQFVVARSVLLHGYSQLEHDKTLMQIGSAVKLLEDQSKQIDALVSDWAQWDDTYNYIKGQNPGYIEDNYSQDTFRHLNINGVVVVEANGKILCKKSLDPRDGQPRQFPELLEKRIPQWVSILKLPADSAHVSGLFWTPEGVQIVSAFPVLPSNGKGASNGILVMMRSITPPLLRHIEQIIDARLVLKTTSNPDLSANDLAAMASIKTTADRCVIPLHDQEVAGYAVMENIGDSGKFIVRTVSDRKIFAQGEYSLNFLLWSMALIALAVVVFGWLLDKLVLSRVAYLSDTVKRIGESASSAARVQALNGDDEISSLGHSINGMLERLYQAQRALHFEKERAQATLAGIADAVIVSDKEGYVTYMNKAAETLAGITRGEASGKTLPSLFCLMSEDKTTPIDSTWLTDPFSQIAEVIFDREDGQEFIVQKSTAPLHDPNGNHFGTVTVLQDITTLRLLSRQLFFQARHDALTGLINRYEFDRRAQNALEDAFGENRIHCLAYLDLDQFKAVNDTCGHMAGDMLLRQFAAYLKGKMRHADTLARLGGDEFALLLTGCDAEKGYEVLSGLLQAIQAFRFTFDDKIFKVGASIGLTEITSGHSHTLSELLITADSACYAAKAEGGNRIRVYHPEDKALLQQSSQLEWLSRIHRGLEKNQFILYVQRIKSLKPDGEQHCELLLRMQDDDGTLHQPGYFLPIAERYNLMPRLDRWVLQEALPIIASKKATAPCVYAINLSGQSFSDVGFLAYVIDQIKTSGVDTRRLCFEITETAVIANFEKARRFIRVLREMGCRFSLDDFGSGLSSFSYLKSFEVDFLKIDGIFVKSIVNSKIDRAMVESINHVGHVMGLHNIAEYVENDEIIQVLKEIGVDYAQGYGVAMPELFQEMKDGPEQDLTSPAEKGRQVPAGGCDWLGPDAACGTMPD